MTSLRRTELDRTNFADFRDRILAQEAGEAVAPRSYPGYPRWPLPRAWPRLWPPLELVLSWRRSQRRLGSELPSRRALGRLLRASHGCTADLYRGPVPSAGGLQGLELYVVAFSGGWLPAGLYHYDRPGHHLSQLAETGTREDWGRFVPSLGQVEGGALLWVLVGDGGRLTAKYGERGERFGLLEAGHLMQNLCLASVALGLATVPLGGYFEQDVARTLALPAGDVVLYLGVCGRPLAR